MKQFLTLLAVTVFSTTILLAQPVNDDCAGLVDLGTVPTCPPNDIFTNVDATASDIGFGNLPVCFNGGTVERDVWFSFTVPADILDVTISVLGTDSGPNGQPITNPEIALYRGEACAVDQLAELACVSSPIGGNSTSLDVLGLTPGITYYIRVNDYSASGTPNWGDFTLCVDEYVPNILCGTAASTTACFGTFLDSGGEDGDYGDNENCVFTICPADFHQCMALNVSFNIEQNSDFIRVYAGATTGAPLLAQLTGVDNGNGFEILATSDCVTIEFTSDGSVTSEGFEITWQCSPLACDGSTAGNPTTIPSIPFFENNTTCDDGATFAGTACTNDAFLNGPEAVYVYTSPGDICAQVEVLNAEPGTGVLVLNGPPDDPQSVCVAQSPTGIITSANFETAGDYYIIVANGQGCTSYDLNITEADCALSPALVDALCNPLNGCIEDTGVPSIFFFEDGFQDMDITDANDGCWGGVGAEPDFFWFTIEAQADGPFGFILESADVPSDIDFNVWGPFDPSEVCDTPNDVVSFISSNEPVRSSYDGGTEPTGLANIHPQFGYEITEGYDCEDAFNDDVVSAIDATAGEVYVVLVNDWGNQIEGGILVDWSPSEPAVLDPLAPLVLGTDTTICAGETLQIAIDAGLDNIEWIGDNVDELSCDDCFTPIASPSESTIYRAVVEAVCYTDTIKVEVDVFDLEAGPGITVCMGEEFEIPAGQDFDQATYAWTPPAELEFSCTDCPTPVVTASSAGVYNVPVTLTAQFCDFQDMVTITVLAPPAPEYEVVEDAQICAGESIAVGGPASSDVTYEWSTSPGGAVIDMTANPTFTPEATTTYYLAASNLACPFPSVDSVTVSVVPLPITEIVEMPDTLCQGDTIALSNTVMEDAPVTYSWNGPDEIIHPDSNFTLLVPQQSGIYTLTADRLGCQTSDEVEVNVVAIDVVLNQPDTVRICLGEQVDVSATVTPETLNLSWDPAEVSGTSFTASPTDFITYTATVSVGNCARADAVSIQVDSLPTNLDIMVDPDEESYCQGEIVTLVSPIFEPGDFPFIEHQWDALGAETADTLYNLVLTTVDTFTYQRITTSGACVDTAEVTLNVIVPSPLNITPDTTICEGQSVQLEVSSDQIGEISWEPTTGLSCDDCLNPVASPTSTTQYTVTNDVDGCPVMTNVTITVDNLPTINLVTDAQFCLADAMDLPLNLASAEADVTYSWTSPDDPAFSSDIANPVVNPMATTTYTLTATNACGERSGQVTYTIFQPPVIEAGTDVTTCVGTEFTVSGSLLSGGGGDENFTWIYDGESSVGMNANLTAGNAGPAVLNYTYGPNGSCGTVMDSLFVDALDIAFTVEIVSDPAPLDTVFEGQTFVLNAIVDPAGAYDYSYTWMGPGIPADQINNPTVEVTAPLDEIGPAEYSVEVSIPEGCISGAAASVEIVEPQYRIPNVFTPNGDGINEVFKLFVGGEVEDFNLQVYNRWGQRVFETNDVNEAWDGTYNGEPAPSDSYIYRINFRIGGVDYPEEGQVTLVR